MPTKAFVTISANEIDSPYMERYVGTGRARCRICGEKIDKGAPGWQFAHTLGHSHYDAHMATECRAHAECLPHAWPL